MSDIAAAVRQLLAGKLVALPTETVYGLAADATNPQAVRKIFATKGRPTDHPLIVHLADPLQMTDWASNIPPAAWKLAEAFWPGPLTLILQGAAQIDRTVTGGRRTIALRVPSHPVAAEVLRAVNRGLAAPSANRFGKVSPTTAAHVRLEFANVAADELLILEGGTCAVGLESTIVDLSREVPALLRPGAITRDMLTHVLGHAPADADVHSPQVSGSLPSHYAPRAEVKIFRADQEDEILAELQQLVSGGRQVAIVTSVDLPSLPQPLSIFHAPGDAAHFAQQLYGLLRAADDLNADCIIVIPPEEIGIGEAIWDRLRKAAAPRD